MPFAAVSAEKPKPGSSCKVLNKKVSYQNKTFTCVKNGKKLVWNKGVIVVKATPTPTPTPTPTATTSLKTISPGAFCSQSEAGQQGQNSKGVIYTCKVSDTENRLRWRQ